MLRYWSTRDPETFMWPTKCDKRRKWRGIQPHPRACLTNTSSTWQQAGWCIRAAWQLLGEPSRPFARLFTSLEPESKCYVRHVSVLGDPSGHVRCIVAECDSAMQHMLAELHKNKVTVYSSCSWEESGSAARLGTTYIHETPTMYYRVYNSTSLQPLLSPDNINPVQATPSYFRETSLIIIVLPTFRSSTWSLAVRFPQHNHEYFSIFPHSRM